MRIALYRGQSWISKLIRWQTRLPYSHAAFLLDDLSVVEAWQPCVRHVANLSAQHVPGTVVDIFAFRVGLTPHENEALTNLALNDLGVKYDYRSIFRFLTRKQADGDAKKLFCSEQVASRCAQIGRELLKAEPWRLAPGHIAWSPLLFLESSTTTSKAT